jgi:hypothetical protein
MQSLKINNEERFSTSWLGFILSRFIMSIDYIIVVWHCFSLKIYFIQIHTPQIFHFYHSFLQLHHFQAQQINSIGFLSRGLVALQLRKLLLTTYTHLSLYYSLYLPDLSVNFLQFLRLYFLESLFSTLLFIFFYVSNILADCNFFNKFFSGFFHFSLEILLIVM